MWFAGRAGAQSSAIALLLLVALLVPSIHAKRAANDLSRRVVDHPRSSLTSLDNQLPGQSLRAASVHDTTVLAFYTFESPTCNAQGWTSTDWTAQRGDYWHIDDFAGLGGGGFGGLNALQGNQSLWCGARPSSDYTLCGYSTLPGYGNVWQQAFCTTACLNVTGDVVVDYMIRWDSEPGYDATYVQLDNCDDDWTTFAGGPGVYDDTGAAIASSVADAGLHAGTLRVRFYFESDGGWSDEDGLFNTDGAVIVDSLTLSDGTGVVLPTELFETEASGEQVTASGNWAVCTPPGYGDYSALYWGSQLLQQDPCVTNLSCSWAFFSGSTYDYGCGGFPGVKTVPYGNTRDQYINNMVESPWIPNAGAGSQYEYSFDLYRDMPLDAIVFYMWAVRSLVNNCPTAWADRASVGGYGGQKDWIRVRQSVGDLIAANATDIQLTVGVVDMCKVWCGVFGSGNCHSHAPLFDNVELIRIAANGPQWSVRASELFQDNFAGDGTITGIVRADIARDVLPNDNPAILPGDSVVFSVADPEANMAADPYTGFGTAAYMYTAVWPQNQSGKGGGALTQDTFRWPVVDSLTHDGATWYCVRADTSFTNSIDRIGRQPDAYCVDLNDNLFTPGDTICFVFCAENSNGKRTYYSEFTGPTDDLAEALNSPMEFTCLPAGGYNRGGDILYVDAFDGYGAQPFFDTGFTALAVLDRVDRYDVRYPIGDIGNGLGSRVTNVQQQVTACYRKIIWNSGDLVEGTIGDGTGEPEKSDDFGVLYEWIHNLPNTGGLWLSGDGLAGEWSNLIGINALNLRSFLGYTVYNSDHVAFGVGVSPFTVGEANSIFDSVFIGPDTLVAFGGCPGVRSFDVISPAGIDALLEASYQGKGMTGGAIVSQKTINFAGFEVGVLLSGFSYHYIREDKPRGEMARVTHMTKAINWLGNSYLTGTHVPTVGYTNTLGQNYPNPFNPTTTITFSLAEPSHVSLRVYNVAGQLVRTLVEQPRPAGELHRVQWDGRSDSGQGVASGVYFYRLTAAHFVQTRKMVLLK